MERISLKRVAIVGALALSVALSGALTPASSPAQATEPVVRGGPACGVPCPPPKYQES